MESKILLERGRHSLRTIKEVVLTNFSTVLDKEKVRLIQRLELFDFLEYVLITNDLTKTDIELIITKKKFAGFIPGKHFPVFTKEVKECTCSSLDYFRYSTCRCGATGY